MARPTKQGIDYFPLDVDFDEKHEMYILEKEAVGLAVLISIWQMIYKNEGYFTHNGDDLYLLIKKRISTDVNEVSECIKVCLRRGLFDSKLYNKYGILTSKALQKRYFDAAKKKKEVRYDQRYLLIDVSVYDNLIKVDINGVNSNGNSINIKEEEEVNEEVNEEEIKTGIPFQTFWDLYDKKVGDRTKIEKKWNNLAEDIQIKSLKHITEYKEAQPDKQYRKNPETYLNQKSWNDEIIRKSGNGTFKSIFETDEFKQRARRIAESIANDPDLK